MELGILLVSQIAILSETSSLHQRQGTNTGAAVCIFEVHNPTLHSYDSDQMSNNVQGLARMVQVNNDTCIVDITMHNLLKDRKYWVYISKTGDLSEGPVSAGCVLEGLGEVEMDEQGWGDCLVETDRIKVWDVIGHGMVVAEKPRWDGPIEQCKDTGKGILAGVIARSAGTWENAKKVCSCEFAREISSKAY